MAQKDDQSKNGEQDGLVVQRRPFLKASAAGAVGGTVISALLGNVEAASTAEKVLLDDSFEDRDTAGWQFSGNSQYRVTSNGVPDDEKALEIWGQSGGCWETLAHYDLGPELPAERLIRITAQVKPTTEGQVGCHSSRGAFNVRAAPEPTPDEEGGRHLLGFQPDGTLKSRGKSLSGTYNVDAWNDVEVTYIRDSGEVDLSFTVNGTERGTVTRPANDKEETATYFTFKSADVHFYINEVRIISEPLAIPVEIDIKPGNDRNAINPDDRGVIPVAILHTDDFDPTERVDVSTLRFGAPDVVDDGGGASPAHNGHVEDVDNDGDDDLVVHFPTQDTGFDSDDEEGKLVGETHDGTPLFGTDSVKIVR
jgi:hypothetical protein